MKLFWFFVFLSGNSLAQITITGTVRDAKTGQPLPFVSVQVVGGKAATVTDNAGEFRLVVPSDSSQVLCSFLGFEPVTQRVSREMVVLMSEQSRDLAEVRVRFINPAHRIIAGAVANRAQNDPEQISSFRYDSYTKSVITADVPNQPADRHLFVVENQATRHFVRPNLSKEIITATRTSGTQTTMLASFAMLMQPFGFYQETITFQGRRLQEMLTFLNPISPNSHTRYEFFLADTLLHSTGDSTFVIEFEPKPGKGFSGLKGLLHIHSTDYALQYVKAQPADPNQVLSFALEQEYEQVDNHWFPVKLAIDWILPQFKLKGRQLTYRTQTWLSAIELNRPVPMAMFDERALEISPQAMAQTDGFWATKQAEILNPIEQNTYDYYRSLSAGKRFWQNALLNVSEWWTAGVIPVGKTLELGTQNLFDANVYEGVRPTINLLTNQNFSQFLRLDGKVGYGFTDQAWKYEGRVRVNLNEARRMTWTLGYRNDISEPANVQYFIWNFPQIPYELVRTFMISRADKLRQWKSELTMRVLRYGTVSVSVTDEIRSPTYAYKYVNPEFDMWAMGQFHTTEIGLGMRYAYNEKFSQIGRGNIISQTPSPTISAHIAKGVMAFTGSDLDYVKLNVKLEYTVQTRGLGETFLNLSAGKTWGDLPYPYLYNGRGSLASTNLIWVANHFQTMGLYEFASDQYANAFVTHSFKNLLGKPRVSWTKPEVSVVQAFAIGSLSHRDHHEGVDFNTLEKGYFETGMLVDNLYRQKIKGLVYIGAGLGVFRRWGSYTRANPDENWAVRLVWNIGI